ncbi:MAG: sulfurtransferase TusA family protein [Elusimicrobiota bacterium]
MATVELDTVGLKCPQPVLKVTAKSAELNEGDVLEIVGDCPTFEQDLKTWCERMNKEILFVKDEGGGKKRIQIQF